MKNNTKWNLIFYYTIQSRNILLIIYWQTRIILCKINWTLWYGKISLFRRMIKQVVFFFFVSSKKYKTLDFSDVYRDNNIYFESNDYLSDVLVMMT